MKQISQHSFEQAMKGIVSDTDAALRDEAPQAYKVNTKDFDSFYLTLPLFFNSIQDLTTVMANQESLVKVVHRLRPLINVKGMSERNTRSSRKIKKRN